MVRSELIALGLVFAGSAFAQAPYTAAEMQALLAKGLVVSSSDLDGGKTFTAASPCGRRPVIRHADARRRQGDPGHRQYGG